MKRVRDFSAALAIIASVALGILGFAGDAKAQGFPCINPFLGVQPQQTSDCSNPPLTYLPQGVTAASNAGLASVIPIGSVAYASLGNATTYISAQVFVSSLYVPFDMTVTNVNILNGGTVGTNACIASLYNTAGTVIRTSLLTGTTTSGANAFQAYALTSTVAIQGPGRYFVSIQCNGATDNVRTVAASTYVGIVTQSNAGVFGTIPALTPPTTFTANVGPIAFLN